MKIEIKAEGLAELQKQFEALASQSEIDETNKKIFRRCADVTKPAMRERIPQSSDNSRSGKAGYRPKGHARDHIPSRATKTGATVGWNLKGDADNYFYLKFVEWGTSKQPPRDFIYNTRDELDPQYSQIAEEELQAAINRKLGG